MMLRVTIELVPGGNEAAARPIATLREHMKVETMHMFMDILIEMLQWLAVRLKSFLAVKVLGHL